jgi:hypothetical protein
VFEQQDNPECGGQRSTDVPPEETAMTPHQSERPDPASFHAVLARIPGVTLCPTCRTYRYPHACQGIPVWSEGIPVAELALALVDADMREDQATAAPALDTEASAQHACPHGWTATRGKRGDYCRPCRRGPDVLER